MWVSWEPVEKADSWLSGAKQGKERPIVTAKVWDLDDQPGDKDTVGGSEWKTSWSSFPFSRNF